MNGAVQTNLPCLKNTSTMRCNRWHLFSIVFVQWILCQFHIRSKYMGHWKVLGDHLYTYCIVGFDLICFFVGKWKPGWVWAAPATSGVNYACYLMFHIAKLLTQNKKFMFTAWIFMSTVIVILHESHANISRHLSLCYSKSKGSS